MSKNYKKIIFALVVGIGLVVGYIYLEKQSTEPPLTDKPKENYYSQEIIGYSTNGRKIEAYTFGNGEKEILFVGGIHGGYEWNTSLLAYEAMDYLENHPEIIPEDIKVTIIPTANPDGLYQVTQKEGAFFTTDVTTDEEILVQSRFNAKAVDLNRNFACKWQPQSTWRGETVSAGEKAFSEPEAQAIRKFVLKNKPLAVVFWHSQANTVYASECENGVLPQTLEIMNLYAQAANYSAVASFDSYEVTGDAEGWLASIGIPALTVELETHESTDRARNLAGIKALLQYFSNNSTK